MRLILIRHGRPEWHLPSLLSLSQFEHMSADYDAAHLSSEGKRAIGALAERLPPYPILSSDLLRARETAEIIGYQNRVIEFDSLFRELQAPYITSGPFDKLWAFPVIWSLVHWCCWILGIGRCAEWPRTAWHRVTQAANKILAHSEREENIILVSHGWFIILLSLYLRWRGLIKRGHCIPKTGYGAMTEYCLRTNDRRM